MQWRRRVIKYELTRGFAYLHIKHRKMHVYTIVLPLIFATLIVMGYFLLPVTPKLAGGGGLLRDVLTMLGILPGFYIAALAAVTTFNSPSMDAVLPRPAPLLRVQIRGEWENIELSKRQFLSYLFSYLVVLSLALSGTVIAVVAIAPSIPTVLSGVPTDYLMRAKHFLAFLFLAPFSFALGSILVTTLHGIYLMTERLDQPL
jgi:vacuolar-type H+-ATPase subunit I/STV1